MKKSRKIILAVIVLAIILMSFVGGQVYAKYMSKVEGSGTAEVANWNFKVNEKDEQLQAISLNSTINNKTVSNNKIAPGTQGSFQIKLDATGAEVGIDYIVRFENESNKPTNLKFTYDNTTVSSLKDLESLLKGRILLSDSRTKTLKIEWSWDYQTGTTEEEKANNDKIDTAEAGKDFSFDILITGTQVNPKE